MTAGGAAWWGARLIALALVAAVASLVWRASQAPDQADRRPFWIEPGEYRGPADSTLDQSQVQAITERAQQSNY
jgi:hypothetical protein